MTNTGSVRVNIAIAVPTMSAKRWEYVSALADWLFEFIETLKFVTSLVVRLSCGESCYYFNYFLTVICLVVKNINQFLKCPLTDFFILSALDTKSQSKL